MRLVLVICSVLTVLVMVLLANSSRNTSFSEYYWPLLFVNLSLVMVIIGLIVYQLYGLIRRLKNHVFGSRLTLQLVALLATLGIIPVALVYIVSVQFMTRSIESWFDVRVEKALESGIDLGQRALSHLQKDQEHRLRQTAVRLSEMSAVDQQLYLVPAVEQLGSDRLTLLTADKRVLFSVVRPTLPKADEKPIELPEELFKGLKAKGSFSMVEPDEKGRIMIYAVATLVAPIHSESVFVLTATTVPEVLTQPTENVQSVYRDYQEISTGREHLKNIYLLTLTMVSISTLFGSVAFGFLFSKRLAEPLSVLAEGTRAVAEGDYTPRQDVGGVDELSLLTRSFNQMTRQLDDARATAESSRQDVESARAYLENILLNLSTGVLAFDHSFCIKIINQGAQQILNDNLRDLFDTPLPYWVRQTDFAKAIYEQFNSEQASHWQLQKEIESAERVFLLLIRGSRLPEEAGGGYVVVFDDISQLVQAQKLSAWSEVAQRLAHEIKNPLTPIRLSAERLLMKLSSKLEEEDVAFLTRSTSIIVDQVESMKTMVNSFRLYAKLPAPKLEVVDLNRVIQAMLSLYDGVKIRLDVSFDETLPAVMADADQLRQVLHNLIQNAQDAQQDQEEPAMIRIVTKREAMAMLVIEDNGPGFPETLIKRAFEPYITTKSKGTGLGLPIVKKIIDEHHGTIMLENLSPRGGRITIGLTYG